VTAAAPLVALARFRTENNGLRIVARMPVDPADAHLAGHFPGMPIYPGVFVIETLAQAMAAAVPGRPRLRSVVSARFQAALLGGDELELTADLTATTDGWNVKAVGRRRDGLVSTTLRATFDAGTR
jgi:3-hydroxyacyl-[acyl-carrier-protein] dehydratase